MGSDEQDYWDTVTRAQNENNPIEEAARYAEARVIAQYISERYAGEARECGKAIDKLAQQYADD